MDTSKRPWLSRSTHFGVSNSTISPRFHATRSGLVQDQTRAYAGPGHSRRGLGARTPDRLLSNLHLGARDPTTGGHVMLGKTFKGLTDQMLTWLTQRLLTLETVRDRYTVHVRPELVAEVVFNEVQESRRYPGGVAFRFARIKPFRGDKNAAGADTIDTVRALRR